MNNEKDAKMDLVAEKTLILFERSGPDAVTFSRVAQLAKVSRPWLYKYIGSKKDNLVAFAADHFGKTFALIYARPKPQNPTEWMQSTSQGFERILALTEQHSWFLNIYYRYRGTTGLLGEKIASIESLFIRENSKELQKALKLGANKADQICEFLLATRMGLIHHCLTAKNKEKAKQVTTDNFKLLIELSTLEFQKNNKSFK